jgi:hypothetical protein
MSKTIANLTDNVNKYQTAQAMLGNALTNPDSPDSKGTGWAYPVLSLESLVFLGITITRNHRPDFWVWGLTFIHVGNMFYVWKYLKSGVSGITHFFYFVSY